MQMYCNGIQLLWSIILFLATMSGIRSAYILMLVVLIPAIANFLLVLLQLQRSGNYALIFHFNNVFCKILIQKSTDILNDYFILIENTVIQQCLWVLLGVVQQFLKFIIKVIVVH